LRNSSGPFRQGLSIQCSGSTVSIKRYSKKYGLTEPQVFAAPLMAVWNITQACNLACEHCYQNAGASNAAEELTTEEKLMVVDKIADAMIPLLAIAGGEPLVARDIWDVLERAKRRGIHMTIATNGTLLTREHAARLKECGVKYIEISIDTLDPEEHDRFRGRNGAWEKAVQGIRNCVEGGIRTGLATTFTRRTVERAEEMIRFAIDLGCVTFTHFNFIPVGRGQQCVEHDLTPDQREKLLKLLNDFLQEGKINVLSTAPQLPRICITHAPLEGLIPTGHAGRGPGTKARVLARYLGGCGAGRCYCSIQPNGDVTPCVYMSSLKVGSLKQNTFADIWECETFRILRDRTDRGDHCGVCDFQNFCGGCRARAFAYTEDLTAGDPGCLYNIHEWKEVSKEAVTADESKGDWKRRCKK
jgi:radical SAM protein with 4Fe4S-binding SPASM domain